MPFKQMPFQTGSSIQKKAGNLLFIGVGRVSDGIPLAWMNIPDGILGWHSVGSAQPGENAVDVFRKLLSSASLRMQAGQKTRLQWNTSSFCCLMSPQGDMLAAAVTADMDYPERFVSQMLSEFLTEVKKEEYVDVDRLIQLMELGDELAGVSLAGTELFRLAGFSKRVGDLRRQIAQALKCHPTALTFLTGKEKLAEDYFISDFASIVARQDKKTLGEGMLNFLLAPVMEQKLDFFDNYHSLIGNMEESSPNLAVENSLPTAPSRIKGMVYSVGAIAVVGLIAVGYFMYREFSGNQALRGMIE